MNLYDCILIRAIKKHIATIAFIIIAEMILIGWILTLSGCAKRRTDFSQSYSYCEVIGDKNMYYGGITLIFGGVMCLLGGIVSLLVANKSSKHNEKDGSSDTEAESAERMPLNGNTEYTGETVIDVSSK